MKLIKPSFEIIEQLPGLEGIYKIIEQAGRTCYRSFDKITEDSAKPFVDRMLSLHHGSVLEHGTVYLAIPYDYVDVSCKLKVPIVSDVVEKYKKNPYTKWWLRDDIFSRLAFITTNYRVLLQGDYKTWEEASKNNYDKNWLDDLKYLCEPTEFHEKRICTHFTSDIHFYKDVTRHRLMSYAIESTRFCNYIKEKFGSSINFAIPIWLKEEEESEFEEDLKTVENIYFKWLKKGWQPQQAAYFLIQGTKADIIMTGFVSDYQHVFDLRTSIAKTGKAHPSVIELFDPLYEEFIKRGYING